MRHLLDGDPLGLKERCVARRDERALLISSDRVWYRSVAQVAYNACVRGPGEPLDEWLIESVDGGIDGLLRDEEAAHRDRVRIEEDEEPYYHAVTDLLDIPVERARGIGIAFNALPFEARNAYFEYARMRSGRPRVLAHESGSLRTDLARALLAILTVGGALE